MVRWIPQPNSSVMPVSLKYLFAVLCVWVVWEVAGMKANRHTGL